MSARHTISIEKREINLDNLALAIGGMGLVTFGLRYAIFGVMGRADLPQSIVRLLRYVPASVLAAITLPELINIDAPLLDTLQSPRLWAGVIAIAIAWRTRNMLLTIIAGMATLWLLTALLGA